MSLEAACGLYTHTHTHYYWPSCLFETLHRVQQQHPAGLDSWNELQRSLHTLWIRAKFGHHYDWCRIWPYKWPISLTLSNHMPLTLIYPISHLHVRAGSRPSPPVRRKYVKASCRGTELITEPSTKGTVLRGDQPRLSRCSYFGGLGLFIEEVNTEPAAPALAKFRRIFVGYHWLYSENPPQPNQDIIQHQTDLVTGLLLFFFKWRKHNLRQDVDVNLLDQPEVGNLARTSP